MKEQEKYNPLNIIYDEENINEVSKQITDAYNSAGLEPENIENHDKNRSHK